MSTPLEKIEGIQDEIIEMTSLENFKKIRNLEQFVLSLESKVKELEDIINQRKGLN